MTTAAQVPPASQVHWFNGPPSQSITVLIAAWLAIAIMLATSPAAAATSAPALSDRTLCGVGNILDELETKPISTKMYPIYSRITRIVTLPVARVSRGGNLLA